MAGNETSSVIKTMAEVKPMAENQTITCLPAAGEDHSGRNVPVPLGLYRTSAFTPEVEAPSSSVPLSHYLWILRRNWWKILLFVICSMAGTVMVSSRLIPIYEATATIDIDRQMP